MICSLQPKRQPPTWYVAVLFDVCSACSCIERFVYALNVITQMCPRLFVSTTLFVWNGEHRNL